MKKLNQYLICLCISFGCLLVSADDTRPLTKKEPPKEEEKYTPESDVKWPAQTWKMPAEKIVSQRYSDLDEEDLIGSYKQPRWTAHRRFAGTRIYVLPEGEIDTEFWAFSKIKKKSNGGGSKNFTQTEIEFGLPHRFQFDFYFITRHESNSGKTYYDFAPEIRYALGNWGELWGNPTLYLEYKYQEDAPDVVESKILFGGEIASHWHWGTNFVWEQETSGERECVLELTNAISYTILDEKFSVGLESKSEIANVAGDREHWGNNVRVGPSIQYRPIKRMHLDFVAIFGVTSESRAADVFFIIGYEF